MTSSAFISVACSSPTTPCLPGVPANAIITCSSTAPAPGWDVNNCLVWTGCTSYPTPPLYCLLSNFIGRTAGIYLDSGVTGTVANGVPVSGNQKGLFAFGAIGVAGFIIIISVAIGVIAIVGINIVGSGENSEAIHALFIGGSLLGLWTILSVAEGFLSQSSTSFFISLNGAFAHLGDITYIVLSLIYVIGIIGAVSRGSG